MNMTPVVSIVMPAYNAAPYIEQTIESVIKQTFKNWELLVINDCSTDNTVEVVERCQSVDSRIKLFNLDKNRGAPAGPRNIGVQYALGNWIALLDSDDIWHQDKLALQMDVLKKSNAKFCSTMIRDFCGDEPPKLDCRSAGRLTWVTFRQQLVRYRTPTSSVVAEKSLLLKHPFNEDITYKAREDLDCWLHCHDTLKRSIKILSPLVGYRVIEGQISGNKWVMVKRHFNVLRKFKYESGRSMNYVEALAYTFTHFLSALLLRRLSKGL